MERIFQVCLKNFKWEKVCLFNVIQDNKYLLGCSCGLRREVMDYIKFVSSAISTYGVVVLRVFYQISFEPMSNFVKKLIIFVLTNQFLLEEIEEL